MWGDSENFLISDDLWNVSISECDDEEDGFVLTKRVVDKKIGSDRGTFTGNINAVTGELLDGVLVGEEEQYEGPFSRGGKRHGEGATCFHLEGDWKFVGT